MPATRITKINMSRRKNGLLLVSSAFMVISPLLHTHFTASTGSSIAAIAMASNALILPVASHPGSMIIQVKGWI
jgi:hypothetical protein